MLLEEELMAEEKKAPREIKATIIVRNSVDGTTAAITTPNASKQLDYVTKIDKGFRYSKDNLVKPELDLMNLSKLYKTNYAHAFCVNAKAACKSGVGWQLESCLSETHEMNDQEMKSEIDHLEDKKKRIDKVKADAAAAAKVVSDAAAADAKAKAAKDAAAGKPAAKPAAKPATPPAPTPTSPDNEEEVFDEEDKQKLAEYKKVYAQHMKDKKTLLDLFRRINPEDSFTRINVNTDTDIEAFGFSCWEVIRDGKNRIVELYHMPAVTVRMMSNNLGVCQVKSPTMTVLGNIALTATPKGNNKVFFKKIGGNYVMDKDTGGIVGEIKDGEITWLKDDTGKSLQIPEAKQANEVIIFRKYNPDNFWYGITDITPALSACSGDRAASEYNEQFFDNNAVPRMAVVLEGASMNDTTKEMIEKFFDYDIKGNAHCTLVLEAPGAEYDDTTGTRMEAGKIHFEKLAMDITDASFQSYRKDNRDQIFIAHRVPQSLSPSPNNQSGRTGDSAQTDLEIFKSQVVRPAQEEREFVINRHIVEDAYGIGTWRLRFKEIDTIDQFRQMQIHSGYLKENAMTINEVRAKLGLPPKKGGDIAFRITPVGLVKLEDIEDLSTLDLTTRPKAPLSGADQGTSVGGRPAKPTGKPKPASTTGKAKAAQIIDMIEQIISESE
jgi:HK97 family phage portal protein